jgi:hypothetical protein
MITDFEHVEENRFRNSISKQRTNQIQNANQRHPVVISTPISDGRIQSLNLDKEVGHSDTESLRYIPQSPAKFSNKPLKIIYTLLPFTSFPKLHS